MVEFNTLQDAGIIGTIAIGMGVLLRWMIQKNANQIDIVLARSFKQADEMVEMAKGIIKDNMNTMNNNTETLKRMNDALISHMEQKDKMIEAIHIQTGTLVTSMKDCRNGRDRQLKDILKKQ